MIIVNILSMSMVLVYKRFWTIYTFELTNKKEFIQNHILCDRKLGLTNKKGFIQNMYNV